MADTSISIRVSEDTRKLFNELVDKSHFENKGDFVNRLLLIYQSEMAKESSNSLRPAFETVNAMSSRLLEVLNGVAATIITNEETRLHELEQLTSSFEEKRGLLEQQIAEMKQELTEAAKNNEELESRIAQLENTINDKDSQIDNYRENMKLHNLIERLLAKEAEPLNDTENS